MSRGFVKEDDQEEAPFIPPRAPLPAGVLNYVTPRGLELLLKERAELEHQRSAVTGSEDERRRSLAELDGRLALLHERIASARVVEPTNGPHNEVRFGHAVGILYRSGPSAGERHTFRLVGVDEAHVKEGLIAFTSPVARALMGHRVGDEVELPTGGGIIHLRIEAIQ